MQGSEAESRSGEEEEGGLEKEGEREGIGYQSGWRGTLGAKE